jgi:RimJ/RimL family protein N-acetyltransferase
MMQPPARVELGDDVQLRFLDVADAPAVARSVRESLEHLRPWMPWADERSGEVAFQRERIRRTPELRRRGEEWQYGLFPADESRLLGSFGLMTRRGPGTIEIGYWLHVDAVGHGYGTRAVEALREVALEMGGVKRVLIYCDEANLRSAAIARRAGFRLVAIELRAREAPAESGRQLMWSCEAAGRA